MTNEQKAEMIKPWVNPSERVTVDFQDSKNVNAEVVGCTDNVVHLLFQEVFPHMKERVTIPLRLVQLTEDHNHYTRDPKARLQWRLRLQVDQPRPDGL